MPLIDLTSDNLNLPRERTYFVWVLIVSVVAWALLAISVIGLAYAALIAVFLWIGHGLLVAHLRAGSVRVDERQLLELHTAFAEVCRRLDVKEIPALYIVQSGGLLNAFATRFAGRNFVVVFSEYLEALGTTSVEMKFVLGHEIGHIRSRHILKHMILAPGLFCPLIGPAYRRAWESSCDRFGAFAAQDVDGSVRAMMVLGGGKGHGRQLSAEAFAAQYTEERGFFVSLYELTSTYPTLSRRVADIAALKQDSLAQSPKRSPMAYLLALFIPGGNFGGSGPAGAMVFVVIIGLLAAMAIPAFQKVRQNAQAKVCWNNERIMSAALDQFRLENGRGANGWNDIIGQGKVLKSMPQCPNGGIYSAKFDAARGGYVITCSVHSKLSGAPIPAH